MNILPGEPVPPGFEDEVNRVAEIQQAIDQYKGNALVGLEYTVELYEEDREPGYICLLCDKRGDPRTIMQHWTSFNHRIKYLEKHFPSAVREFNPVKYKPNSHSIMIMIVQSLAEAIEDHHGRLTLSVCNSDEFRRQRSKIQKEINEKFHIDERNGPNFLNVIDRTLWETKQPAKSNDQTITIKTPAKRPSDERQKRVELDEISSEDESSANDANKKQKVQSPAYRILPRVRRSPPFEEERENIGEKKLPTPKELSLQASHIAQERYKWEKYRCMLEIQLKQMEKIQQDYEKNPEKHPLYPDEWKKFWNRRYKELQAEKKTDPNTHDYKPEWITFWTKRMQELFKDEVEKKKKEIKVRLGLPENAEEKVDQLKEKYKVQVSRSAAGAPPQHPIIERNKNFGSSNIPKAPSMAVIDISDDDSIESDRGQSNSRNKTRRSRSVSPRQRRHEPKRSRNRSNSRSRSPHSDDYDDARRHYKTREVYERHMHPVPPVMRGYPSAEYYMTPTSFGRSRYPVPPHYSAPMPTYRIMDSHQYPKYERSPSPLLMKEDTASKPEPEVEDEGPLTVVAVLRLLTALEEHLGSLGPKVVDMLGKALALEKVKANSADEMLINDDNCVFFETIKEKLKGLLIADVLDEAQKVKAVKRAVKNIAAIVHQVNEKGKSAANSADADDHKNEEDAANKKKANQTPQIKDLPFDRQVVSTKLAAALVMHGREDVSTEDMDKLIYIFILMTKLTKEKMEIDGRPLLTKDILAELGIAVTKPAPVPAATINAAIPTLVDEFFENEVNALVQEVEEEMSNDANEKNSKNDAANASMLESLTDSDLQTLLQNFKHLSTEEQHHLIAHLKKLETADPARVEKLRKFVNLADAPDTAASNADSVAVQSKANDDSSDLNHRRSSSKRYDDSPIPTTDNEHAKYLADDVSERRSRGVNPNKFSLDDEDEDDDYNFEDVFKAASNNVQNLSEERMRKSKRDSKSAASSVSNSDSNCSPGLPIPSTAAPNPLTFNPAGLNISLNDTQNLIANLMGSLQQSNSGGNSSGGKVIKTIPAKSQQQQLQHLQHQKQKEFQHQHQQQEPLAHNNAPFYQQPQHQPQQAFGDFNQMNNTTAGYYSAMGGAFNNGGGAGYPGYQQQWGNPQQMPQQQYGMQNFMTPQQQMGYNMYGRGN